MSEVTKMEPQSHEVAKAADPMVSMIERVVSDPNADLDKLERMLAMKERMDAQHAKVAFAHAISEARAEIPPIMKDAAVDFENKKGERTYYKHETLSGIAKVIDPILSQHGLSYRFRTDQEGGAVIVTCIISHSDGHSEETTLRGAPDQSGNKNGFQAVGSAVTYLQRYTLKAALGLSAAHDDDGQGAEPRPSERQAPATVSPGQFIALRDAAEQAGMSEEHICGLSKMGATSFEQFPAAEFDAAMGYLNRAIKAKAERAQPDDGPEYTDEIPY